MIMLTALSKSKLYRSWQGMKSRCNNPNHKSYKDYGGRGITYDPKWETFKGFFEDMGERPEGKTLDRFSDKDGNYCKNNCRWATREEQANNKRDYDTENPYHGVHWNKNKKLKVGGYWVSRANQKNGKRASLYRGSDLGIAIEARKFYEDFILGIK
jgi:hypothetical protein